MIPLITEFVFNFAELYMHLMIKIIPYSLFMLLLIACKDNKEAKYAEEINGKWNVVRSELNNKPSKSMENAFFHFEKNNTVKSNIFEEAAVPFKLEGPKVTIGSQQPMALDITYFEGDSMVLEGNYSLYFVRFFMKKDSVIQ
jgi:hypothetical protein